MVSSDARSLTDIEDLAFKVKAEFDTFDLLFVNAGFSIPAALESPPRLKKKDACGSLDLVGATG